MAKKAPTDVLEAIDAAVRAGRLAEAQDALRTLDTAKLARPTLSRYANLARRASLPTLAIRALARHVRPAGRRVAKASPEETTEYAAALSALGANVEAAQLLDGLDGTRHPGARLMRAFVHIADWNYAAARDTLKACLPALGDYEARIARVNLAAAHVHENETDEAEALLAELVDVAAAEGNNLLVANLLQIGTQSAIKRGARAVAVERIGRARGLLTGGGNVYAQMLEKWESVLALGAGGAVARAGVERLEALRAAAEASGAWETARDCLYHLALHRASERDVRRLHFGTPFAGYRRRLRAEAERRGIDPAYAAGDCEVFVGKGPATVTWRLDSGRVEGRSGDVALKAGQLLQRLSRAVAADFFRPARLLTLHEAVFPDRYFNPDHSPPVLREAMRRLRAWMRDELRGGVALEHRRGTYRFAPRGAALQLLVTAPGAEAPAESLDGAVRAALRVLGADAGEAFGSGDLARRASISVRTARRYLDRARELGWVAPVDATAHRLRYRLGSRKA